ncbi:MAG: oligosaccharide flippase family protein [Paludibacteraceae bacterium]|nr:oligosaccharide flippase family protein [Paludibacteraceae bacterium]
MNATNKIILNTIILYAKILIVMLVNLWTVPLLLRALGQNDYGLYQLVAGVITMLTFINAAMTISTQRYMSVAMGEKNGEEKLNTIYNVSLILHLLIGIVIVVALEILTPFLFHGFLNIEPDRITAAEWIYQFLIISTFFTILSVPFDAELNAYENMAVFAIISILDSLLRLALVLVLPYMAGDLLIIYGIGMASIAILNTFIKYVYTRKRYKDMYPCKNHFDKKTFKEMFGFAGWNTFSAFAMTGRNQGIAIILNLFLGTIVNAAYGIANQINSLLMYLSATLRKSYNPQLMKSVGMNDNDRMLRFAFSLSKMSVLAVAITSIPLLIEMPYVLSLWLGDNIPENTIEFSRYILILSILYQFSSGLMSAIQSHGIIRNYTLTMGFILLMNLPLTYLLLWFGCPAYYAIIGMILIEIICLVARLCYAHSLCQLPILNFIKQIILPISIITIASSVLLLSITYFIPSSFVRLSIICCLDILLFLPLSYYFVFSEEERQSIVRLISPITNRFKK